MSVVISLLTVSGSSASSSWPSSWEIQFFILVCPFNPLSELLVKLHWSHLNTRLDERTSAPFSEWLIAGLSVHALELQASSEMATFSATFFLEDFFLLLSLFSFDFPASSKTVIFSLASCSDYLVVAMLDLERASCRLRSWRRSWLGDFFFTDRIIGGGY